jgi:predicted O-methyltransferase YrrM
MVAQRHLWRHAMTDPLNSMLFELEQFGTANDASTTERPRRMLNITRDTGEFLSVLVKATRARRVLEIGTVEWLLHALARERGSLDWRLGDNRRAR